MPRRAGRKAPRTRRWVWVGAWLGCIALVGLAYLAGRRAAQQPPSPPPPALTALQDLLGPLEGPSAEIRVADAASAAAFVDELREAARRDGVAVIGESRGPSRIRVRLDLPAGPYPVVVRWARPPAAAPRLALVIDDMGRNLERARAFLDLPIPVTPSVLPYLKHSADVARLARARGRVVLLHLPMEPRGYPRRADPGPHALMVGLSEDEVRARVRRALDSVPGVSGVNNHMGSRFTEQSEPLAWVMDELAGRGLFFLDSLTTARSVAFEAARRAGVPALRRDVFIDNDRTPEAIGRQLERAVARALRTGRAVAIGHPYRVTLETLRAWAPRFGEAGVRVVPLEALLPAEPGG